MLQPPPPVSAITPPRASSRSVLQRLQHHCMLVVALATILLAGCAQLPRDVERPISYALQSPQSTPLGQRVERHASAVQARSDSGFRLLSGTEAAYTSRLALIDAAQKTLDLQYYAILVDQSTGEIVEKLREAAARGVRVRVLLDDFNTTGTNAQFLRLAFERNIEVRLFNPLPGSRSSLLGRVVGSLGNIEMAQRRMHNKLFIADNAVGITGGRNLGDSYFGQSTESNFVDLDVLAAGRIVREMSASFDAYWNNPLAYPVQSLMTPAELDALHPPARSDSPVPAALQLPIPQAAADGKAGSMPPAPTLATDTAPATPPALLDFEALRLTWAPAALLVDKSTKIESDDEAEDTVVDGLLQLMAQTRQDLFIVSPYFVPGARMMEVFAKLRATGVRVRVLTNSLASNDAPLAHVGYARYRKRLLEIGVELYEMRTEQVGGRSAFGSGSAGPSSAARAFARGSEGSAPDGAAGGSIAGSRASLHAKTLVLDARLLVVGSMNLDLRSQLQNSEIALLIRSASLSERALRLIEPTLQQGAYHVVLEQDRLVWHPPVGSGLPDLYNEPDASAGLQFILKLIGPFAPEEML